MGYFELIIGVFATVILFLYGLQSFSREIRLLGEDRLHDALGRLTRNRFSGFALGALFTAVVQSSSAVTALAVALVDAGAISFANSLAVLIGANVGTTVTAWLVSFKLTGIGPLFIIIGAVITILPGSLRVAGKSVFYFGLIFFALDLISNSLEPIKQDPQLVEWLAATSTPLIGATVGALLTALVQSSSVVTGLSILLVQQGAIDVPAAVAIIIGANLGTTVTGLIASIPMRPAAKRTALANLILNFLGVALFLPFAPQLAAYVQSLTDDLGIAVAIAHLIFNLGIAVLALPFVRWMAQWLQPRTAQTDLV
jgi:phosphate:Na+ symporter